MSFAAATAVTPPTTHPGCCAASDAFGGTLDPTVVSDKPAGAISLVPAKPTMPTIQAASIPPRRPGCSDEKSTTGAPTSRRHAPRRTRSQHASKCHLIQQQGLRELGPPARAPRLPATAHCSTRRALSHRPQTTGERSPSSGRRSSTGRRIAVAKTSPASPTQYAQKIQAPLDAGATRKPRSGGNCTDLPHLYSHGHSGLLHIYPSPGRRL